MKNLLFILLLLSTIGSAMAKKDKKIKEPFVGSWKFTNQSIKNDFQEVFENKQLNCTDEYFTFEPNTTFTHQFFDKSGNLLKSLKGKWKSLGDKIKIEYSDINFSLVISYFFLDNDLVLGQNFNHIIFTRNNVDFQNLALK
ncbi:MAG: lipocalin family protein [Chitinophagales bacterium]